MIRPAVVRRVLRWRGPSLFTLACLGLLFCMLAQRCASWTLDDRADAEWHELRWPCAVDRGVLAECFDRIDRRRR